MDFLSNFDHRTTLLLVSIAFFVQTAAIGAQAYLVKEYQGLGTALLGNLCMALGFALLLARNNLPDLLTIIIANLLIITSPLLYYVSISKFGEQTYSVRFIAINLIAASVLLIFYKYGADSFAIRTIIVSFSSAITSFVIVYKLWQLRKHTFNISITLTIVPFILYGGYMVFRVIESISFPADQLFPDTPIQTGITIILFLISFLWTIGFILMGSQRLQADLVKLATIDYLTRIPNRRASHEFLEKELARANRTNEYFSILLIDFDDFKSINDNHGHDTGDQVLLKTAEIFKSKIRKEDLVGRWGGEEFLMVLTGSSAKDALHLGNRLRDEIEKTKYGRSRNISITVSIGVASSIGHNSIDGILKSADKALYQAKVNKNAVIIAERNVTPA